MKGNDPESCLLTGFRERKGGFCLVVVLMVMQVVILLPKAHYCRSAIAPVSATERYDKQHQTAGVCLQIKLTILGLSVSREA